MSEQQTEFTKDAFASNDEAMKELACSAIAMKATALVEEATAAGVVLTISQVSLQPLAMGHYETVVQVRPAR